MHNFWLRHNKFIKGAGVGIFITLLAVNYYIETYVEIPDHVWGNAQRFCSDKGGIFMLKKYSDETKAWCFNQVTKKEEKKK